MAQHRIAFIQARWHSDLVDNCRDSFLSELATLRPDAQVDTFMVPGALEIPLRSKLLADTGDYDAIVTAGLVVDGGIYRHEFVASAVIDGLVRVGLDTGVPVLSVVLTPQQFHEHADHIDFFARHLVKKGEEAARSCSEVLDWPRG